MYNINPEVWGEHGWAFLHYITFAYPDKPTKNEKESMKQLLLSLQYTLPCRKCRVHYQNNLKYLPLTEKILSNRKNLIMWLLALHNKVNLQLGKKQISYNNLLQRYLNKNNNKNKYLNIIKMLFVIILIISIIFIRKNNYKINY
jgi:hypothetical protein